MDFQSQSARGSKLERWLVVFPEQGVSFEITGEGTAVSYGRDIGYNPGSGQLRQDRVRIPWQGEDINEPRRYWRGQQE